MRLKLALLAMAAIPASALAGPCQTWGPAAKVGTLDTSLIMEASGIAVSRRFADRLYHNNDSGDGPFFYVTDRSGAGTRQIRVTGFEPHDVEELAIGRCTGAQSCLYLGDIGDNARARDTVRFIVVAERKDFPATVDPLRMIDARYPDGPHDAESFAIHPDGDLFLITKAGNMRTGDAKPAQIFKLKTSQLHGPPGQVQTFTLVGTIDLPSYLRGGGIADLATSMDISRDGKRTLILAYRSAIEWQQDLAKPFDSSRTLVPERDFTLVPLAPLPQAEGVAYLLDSDGFIYSTELARATEAPLFEERCKRR